MTWSVKVLKKLYVSLEELEAHGGERTRTSTGKLALIPCLGHLSASQLTILSEYPLLLFVERESYLSRSCVCILSDLEGYRERCTSVCEQ